MSAGNARCEHGDTDRSDAGKCRICGRLRKAAWRQRQIDGTPCPRPQSQTGDCPNPLPWRGFKITPSEDGGANRKPVPVPKGEENAHAAVRNLERDMRRMMRGMR